MCVLASFSGGHWVEITQGCLQSRESQHSKLWAKKWVSFHIYKYRAFYKETYIIIHYEVYFYDIFFALFSWFIKFIWTKPIKGHGDRKNVIGGKCLRLQMLCWRFRIASAWATEAYWFHFWFEQAFTFAKWDWRYENAFTHAEMSSSLRSCQAATQLVKAASSWTQREISSLNAADWSFASWYLLTTVFIALPNRPEGEIGVSRRKALSFSFIPIRLSQRCHSRSQNIMFLRGKMQNRKCKSINL